VPFAPVGFRYLDFGSPGFPAPAAYQTVAANWPISPIDPPKPVERYELNTFYLPVSVYVAAGTALTTCWLTPQLFLSGELAFQQQLALPLALIGTIYTANGSADIVVQAPIRYRSGQTVTLGFRVSFDQTVSSGRVGLAAVRDPALGMIPAVGSIGYDILAEPLIIPAVR
jgi:hypothetical protein